MKRRSRAGPEQAKSRRRKTITQKSRGLSNPSVADRKTQSHAAQLTRERDEALEREKATAEVLRVISSSRLRDAMGRHQVHVQATVRAGQEMATRKIVLAMLLVATAPIQLWNAP